MVGDVVEPVDTIAAETLVPMVSDKMMLFSTTLESASLRKRSTLPVVFALTSLKFLNATFRAPFKVNTEADPKGAVTVAKPAVPPLSVTVFNGEDPWMSPKVNSPV